MQFERIWDAAPYAIDHVEGGGEDLVIAFSSVGHDPLRPPSPEFVATAVGRGGVARRALFVMDQSRSWANAPGLEAALQGAVAQVAARGPVRRIVTMGLSMGGFAALVAAQVLPVDAVLAFSPQWSVAPDMGEARWPDWTSALPPVRWPVAPMPDRGQVYLFHGAVDDLPQALSFPMRAGVDHLIFPYLGHSDLVPHLKARGGLAGLVDAAVQGDRRRLLRIAGAAGGVARRRLYPG